MSTDADPSLLGAVEMVRRLAAGELSPVTLVEACIARIERFNPAVNAIAATCYERARQEARASEARLRRGQPRGPLEGLPIGVKDLQETEGLLTTYGSPRFRDFVPDQDAPLVARLRAAGAIVLAKTNVPEMGAGANTRNPVWGATGNPFDPRLNAGGSSGGSAAALALDMLPLCTGSDTGGSLRIPAALCGVVGLRPSPDLIAHPTRPLGWSAISVLGPMARDVPDLCLMLRACVGFDPLDPLSAATDPAAFVAPEPLPLAGLRVGVTADFGVCPIDPEIRAVFEDRVRRLGALGAECVPVELALEEADRCFDVVRAESFVAAFQEAYERDPASLGPNVRANYEMGAAMTLADRAWAHKAQTRIFREFQRAMAGLDLMVAPVTPVTPFDWHQPHATHVGGVEMGNYYQWLALTYVVTLANNPALSLPCGRDARGMPFGLQLIGRFRDDARLLRMALGIEQAFAADAMARRPVPDLAALPAASPELASIVTAAPSPSTGRARSPAASAV
ncbi:MAG: amidase [Burkholderiaceae bacterium]